jgi:GT2 family glycosyltransferase
MGDTDYGLRAKEQNIRSYIAPGYVGMCKSNDTANTWFDKSLTLRERKERLISPLGRPPKEWIYFVKRHGGGAIWVLSAFQLYMRLYFPSIWSYLRRLRRRTD